MTAHLLLLVSGAGFPKKKKMLVIEKRHLRQELSEYDKNFRVKQK